MLHAGTKDVLHLELDVAESDLYVVKEPLTPAQLAIVNRAVVPECMRTTLNKPRGSIPQVIGNSSNVLRTAAPQPPEDPQLAAHNITARQQGFVGSACCMVLRTFL
jgi:hypothetical protein